jgi:hypothetical protein
MAFAEALSDDGRVSGRGSPWLRGSVCGAMTFADGIGHTLSFLVPDFRWAMALALAEPGSAAGQPDWQGPTTGRASSASGKIRLLRRHASLAAHRLAD